MEFQYVELPKLGLGLTLDTLELQWLHVLKYAELYSNGRDLPTLLQQQEELMKAIDLKSKAYAEPDIQEILDARHKGELATATRLSIARKEGLTEGRAEGRAEGARQVAEGMLSQGIAIEVVARASGLSVAQVEALVRPLE